MFLWKTREERKSLSLWLHVRIDLFGLRTHKPNELTCLKNTHFSNKITLKKTKTNSRYFSFNNNEKDSNYEGFISNRTHTKCQIKKPIVDILSRKKQKQNFLSIQVDLAFHVKDASKSLCLSRTFLETMKACSLKLAFIHCTHISFVFLFIFRFSFIPTSMYLPNPSTMSWIGQFFSGVLPVWTHGLPSPRLVA